MDGRVDFAAGAVVGITREGESMSEVWKLVQGFGGHYEASSLGRVRSRDRVVMRKHPTSRKTEAFNYKGKVLSPAVRDKYGHKAVHIGLEGKRFTVGVHRLVLMAFIGPCPDGMEACHNNGDASDNRLENLRWDTHYSNNQDRKTHGTYAVGEAHPMAKLSAELVKSVINRGLTRMQIMEELGISSSQAHRIVKGQSWTFLRETCSA